MIKKHSPGNYRTHRRILVTSFALGLAGAMVQIWSLEERQTLIVEALCHAGQASDCSDSFLI